MVVLVAEGDDNGADKNEDRHKRLDIDRHQQRGDGGTDFRAEKHADRLSQLHQSRVREADHHRVGRGGALNDRRDKGTHQHGDKLVAGDFLQKRSQLVARGKLETLAHVFHTDEEESQTAESHNDVQNNTVSVHNLIPLILQTVCYNTDKNIITHFLLFFYNIFVFSLKISMNYNSPSKGSRGVRPYYFD